MGINCYSVCSHCTPLIHTHKKKIAQPQRSLLKLPVYIPLPTPSQSCQFTIMAGLRLYSSKLFNPFNWTNARTPNIFEQKLYNLGILI